MAGGTGRHTHKRSAGRLLESRRCQREALLAVILGAMPSVPSDGLVGQQSLTHLVTLAEDATIGTSLVWRGFRDWMTSSSPPRRDLIPRRFCRTLTFFAFFVVFV
jgi:hypothetical protein